MHATSAAGLAQGLGTSQVAPDVETGCRNLDAYSFEGLQHLQRQGVPLQLLAQLYGSDLRKLNMYGCAALVSSPKDVLMQKSNVINNKALISALLLTFNIPALLQNPDPAYVDTTAFAVFYLLTWISALLAFMVMISGILYNNHSFILRNKALPLLRYINDYNWIEDKINEIPFVVQLFTTCASVMCYTHLYYGRNPVYWVGTGLLGLMAVGVVLVVLISTKYMFHHGPLHAELRAALEKAFAGQVLGNKAAGAQAWS